MARKLLKIVYISALFLVGCIPAQLLRYNTDIAQATKIKTKAYADFQIFDASHQLNILSVFVDDDKKYYAEMAGYRTRRVHVVDAIKKQAQQDVDANKSAPLLSKDMDDVSSKILNDAKELSTLVENFISDEKMHLSVAKRGL